MAWTGVSRYAAGCCNLLLLQRYTPDTAQKWLRAIAFGAAMCASSAMNNVFVTYHGDFFKNYSKVTPAWFVTGQLIYLLFNASNDPLFGWLSDKWPIGGEATVPAGSSPNLLRRQRALRWGGLAWAVAFTLAWFPWASGAIAVADTEDTGFSSALRGLHFLFALVCYDGALTYVELAHSAVLAEMTRNSAERADANMCAAIGAAIGSCTSILAHVLYDRQDMTSFRIMAVGIAAASVLIFEFSATGVGWDGRALKASLAAANDVKTIRTIVNNPARLKTPPAALQDDLSRSSPAALSTSAKSADGIAARLIDAQSVEPETSSASASASIVVTSGRRRTTNGNGNTALAAVRPDDDDSSTSTSKGGVSYWVFLRQLLSSRNVLVFIVLSTTQTFDCSFEKGFFAPLSDIVVAAADAKLRLEAAAGGPSGHAVDAVAFTDQGALGSGVVSKHTRSVIISLSFLLPHVLTLVWTPLVTGWGMYRTIVTILVLRLVLLAGAALLHGLEPSQSAVSASTALGFMLMNRVLSESVCRLSPLILSDLIDEDTVLHRRGPQHTLSASVVGTAAMFSKASQSLAPLVAYYVLPSDLGHLLSSPGHGDSGTSSNIIAAPKQWSARPSEKRSDQQQKTIPALEAMLERQILKAATIVERGEERALDELMPLESVKDSAKRRAADALLDETMVKAVLPEASSITYRRQLEERAVPLFTASTRVWTLLLVLPSVAVFIQLTVWSRGYTLHGKRLARIKAEADAMAAGGKAGSTAMVALGSSAANVSASSSFSDDSGKETANHDDGEDEERGAASVGTAARRRGGPIHGTPNAAIIAL